jgi:hypothetical protein
MDVQLLREKGEKYSSVFYVDSAKRDRTFYPTPSRYEVSFNEPFRNVFSIQVLDASIPRTHYNVDTHNNVFCYVTGDTEIAVYLPVGDYTDVEIIDEMNQRLNGRITMAFLSSPSDRRNQFIFRSTEPFKIKPFKSTLRDLLGFDQGNATIIESTNDPEHFIKHVIVDNINNTSGVNVPVTKSNMVLYQQFVATATGYIDSIRLQMKLNDIDILNVNQFNLNVRIMRDTTLIATGTTTALALQTSVMITDWESFDTIQEGVSYYFVVNMSDAVYVNYELTVDVVSNERQQLFYALGVSMDFYPDVFFNAAENKINGYIVKDNTSIEELYFGITTNDLDVSMSLAFNLTVSEHVHSIVPHGIYNLLGDRYIVLRCPEIENHIMSSLKSFNTVNPDTDQTEVRQYETGIAKFKMSVVGFREERFDFNILPPQEFHPIGKLTSLTFFFENQDGRLYDFKGVNHTLSLSVNYYQLKIYSFFNSNASQQQPQEAGREESSQEQSGDGASPRREDVPQLYDPQDQYDQNWQPSACFADASCPEQGGAYYY